MADIEKLLKLASEMTDRIAVLEKENAELKAAKTAAAEELAKKAADAEAVAQKPVVPAEVADATVEALLKTGSLDPSQADESKRILMQDPAAAHRVLQRILDAQIQTKTATAAHNDGFDVAGGKLAGQQPARHSYEDDCLDRMQTILRMK